MKTENEIKISVEDFKLIKQFYPEFSRKEGIKSNDFTIGWSELMPVVDKIESLKIKVYQDAEVKNGTLADFQFKRGRNNSYLCLVSYFEHDGGQHKHSRSYTGRIIAEDGVRLKSVYTAVVQFLRWLNSKNS